MPSINSTRRQHYVAQAYLKPWCNSDGKLAASVNGKFLSGCRPVNFAVEVDLYAFIDLSADELGFLYRAICQIMTDENPLINAIVIPIFLNILYFRCKNNDWSDEYQKIFDEFAHWLRNEEHMKTYKFLRSVVAGEANLEPRHVEFIESATVSGFEQLMTAIENAAWPVINSLLTDGARCLKTNDNLRCLLLYLVNQCVRGPDYLQNIESVLPETVYDDGGSPKVARYLRYILPFYVCRDLLQTKDQRKVHIITNRTDLEFVTGDVTCIIYGERENPKTPMILFSPISPKKALLYGSKRAINTYICRYGWELFDRKFVDWFNREIVASSKRFVFASNVGVLRANGYSVCEGRKPLCVH